MKTDAVHALPSIKVAYGGQIDEEEDRWKEDNAVFGLERDNSPAAPNHEHSHNTN